MQRYEILTGEIYKFIVKAFIPAFVAISMKVAIQYKKEKMTPLRIFISYVVGVSSAYFTYNFCKHNVNEDFIGCIVGVVAISSEKITEFIIYKWKVDYFLTSIIEAIREMIINLITKK